MPSFGKGEGSHNSHEMSLSGMPGMVSLYLLVFEPILPIWGSGGVKFPYTLACYSVTLADDSTSFQCGEKQDFMMLT